MQHIPHLPPRGVPPRSPPRPAPGIGRVAMDRSQRSLAISLGQLDEVLDDETTQRLSIAVRRLGEVLGAMAKARTQGISPSLLLLAELHELGLVDVP